MYVHVRTKRVERGTHSLIESVNSLVADHFLKDHAELKVGIEIDSGKDVVEGVVGVEGGRFLIVRDQRRADHGGGGGDLRLAGDGGAGHVGRVGRW